MASMRDIRRRIKTVRNIQQITKALKMVAVARLQKAQSKAAAARPYADEMIAVLGQLASAGGEIQHPLLAIREPNTIGIIVITSDRGMSGSYNTNIIRKVTEMIHKYGNNHVKLVTIGKKGRNFFAKRGFDIIADFPMPTSEVAMADARAVSARIKELFAAAEFDLVRIVYTHFVSALTQRVMDLQLLPVARPKGDEHAKVEDFIFEPSPHELLGSLLPRYVDTQIYRAMLDSLASEFGARMTAMTSATENATEMIDRLTLDLNRARQAAITRELAEIVGGAEALK
jgi:F-type H+-transporting ATPase subunit gamma